MSERRPRRRPARPVLARVAPPLLLLGMAAAIIAWPADAGGLSLANPDANAAAEIEAAFDALPAGALVVVGMDADLGTYPEVRGAVRAAIDDLLARGARLAFVSFSPEGRAIAAAELERRADSGRLADLGFVAGAEAGLVRSVTAIVPEAADGAVADAVRSAGGGIGAFDLALLVGGSDIGPRSWVEQVGTRLPGLPMVAIAPSFAHPELAPYRRSGQLDGLLATVRDDAAFVRRVARGDLAGRAPSGAAMLLGMAVALGVLAVSVVRPAGDVLPGRSSGPGGASGAEGDQAAEGAQAADGADGDDERDEAGEAELVEPDELER